MGPQIMLSKLPKLAEYRGKDNDFMRSAWEEQQRSWWYSQVPQINGFLIETEWSKIIIRHGWFPSAMLTFVECRTISTSPLQGCTESRVSLNVEEAEACFEGIENVAGFCFILFLAL